jgi:prefoldin subunit 5
MNLPEQNKPELISKEAAIRRLQGLISQFEHDIVRLNAKIDALRTAQTFIKQTPSEP